MKQQIKTWLSTAHPLSATIISIVVAVAPLAGEHFKWSLGWKLTVMAGLGVVFVVFVFWNSLEAKALKAKEHELAEAYKNLKDLAAWTPNYALAESSYKTSGLEVRCLMDDLNDAKRKAAAAARARTLSYEENRAQVDHIKNLDKELEEAKERRNKAERTVDQLADDIHRITGLYPAAS